jgi:hypothetical protein
MQFILLCAVGQRLADDSLILVNVDVAEVLATFRLAGGGYLFFCLLARLTGDTGFSSISLVFSQSYCMYTTYFLVRAPGRETCQR